LRKQSAADDARVRFLARTLAEFAGRARRARAWHDRRANNATAEKSKKGVGL
jgi:hypothetical protein